MSALKCKVCGAEFKPTCDNHYVTCDPHDESELFDAYNCPVCGSQYIAQNRMRMIDVPVGPEVCIVADKNEEPEYDVGDQIQIGKYTATCQKVTDDGAIFMLDQYLDKPYRMNASDTNEGGYAKSLLRTELNEDFACDSNFDAIRNSLLPVFCADLVRIPTVGEFFGRDDFYEMDDAEQWALMKERRNRIADREGEEYEWGWLQNRVKESAAYFANVYSGGDTGYYDASDSGGVRPVFMLVKKISAPCGRCLDEKQN